MKNPKVPRRVAGKMRFVARASIATDVRTGETRPYAFIYDRKLRTRRGGIFPADGLSISQARAAVRKRAEEWCAELNRQERARFELRDNVARVQSSIVRIAQYRRSLSADDLYLLERAEQNLQLVAKRLQAEVKAS